MESSGSPSSVTRVLTVELRSPTTAVLLSVPATLGVTTIVTVAEVPGASTPRVQVTGEVLVQVPTFVVTEARVAEEEITSVMVRLSEGAFPLFLTVTVYCKG